MQLRARQLRLAVDFVGAKRGAELRALLNRHRILVVPSRWKEPFGIVALEGIACGCVVVGSRGGGLKDAIGPCGVTFRNGDALALADALTPLLRDAKNLAPFREAAPAHLRNHRATRVAATYIEVIERAVK